MSDNLSLRIGFLGAGKMATALAMGLKASGLVRPDQILASDPAPAARDAFTRALGAKTVAANPDVAGFADVVFLAVKPHLVASALAEVRAVMTPQHLLVSIAAGISLARLEAALPAGVRVVRVMPNTPALVGVAAAGYTVGLAATAADAELVQRLFASVGMAVPVTEPQLDAVTGLSGSGPAYIYLVIEALSDGGVAAGLPRDIATKLAAQTVLGAARMVLDTGLHPGLLKDMVTSPGGTTIDGLHELERGAVRGSFMNAVRAATEKSRQLGRA